MSYKLVFDPRALKEWHKLGETVKAQFKKKLAHVLAAPGVKSARLSGLPDCYKIKLRTSGYRLVYQVRDDAVCVLVIAIGKRENLTVYQGAGHRLE
ncbi:type II toxin-antitoxin system RelE/ParE family toxin [Cronobacter sakazakii]|uniref:type II toxin-antitoxin system RelE family toxin n=1 Tax=Cronobacter sakazakii TaxID=28141 RepID=UPI000CF17BE0|nr:type II toxin-antitoxin system RelE/ParE family toxin [Cronobacter sakazakii]EJQ2006183.1 type II toxin-antitoxin system RelE/ParE family toxin [Cronobacter sakazakii]EJQ2086786.1 type II toxin-antitoxin system RelE/ParE family toxin [Cronobacter sakazakii]EJR9310460.1 type II toxin-antitoxin system RelE/ParE family toxin [Cronobacter sakazakii]EJR9315086.1 type II toxin-antitoxin system RelE/ParE family toxin [Cronobacter sakazakii]EJR9320111.1 type II toxin-antitoxin system RelE/ParE fami